MATDKRYTDLPVASSLSSSDIMAMVDPTGNITYQFTFSQLMTFLSANASLGSNITFGTSAIPTTGGANGDVYVKTDTGQFAQKLSGTWTVVYTIVQGVIGSTIYYGSSTPASGTGINGDTYLQTNGGIFYTKIAGAWTAQFSMATGPAGPRGNSILNGTVDPVNTVGTNGDFYLNTTSLTIFGPKAAGVWPTPGQVIKGTNGNTVLTGTTNPSNTLGNNGDSYINTTTWNIFSPKAGGVWPAGVAIGGYVAPQVYNINKGDPNPVMFSGWFNSLVNSFGNYPTALVDILNTVSAITGLGAITGGSGGTNNTYLNQPLTGGTGLGATADIVVSGGIVQSVTMKKPGYGYTVGDSLSATIPGLTGFHVPVTTIGELLSTSSASIQKVYDNSGTVLQTIFIDNPDMNNANITGDAMRVTFKQ